MRPVSQLDRFLTDVLSKNHNHELLPMVPDSLATSAGQNSRDEFERVVGGLNGLIARVNRNYQLSRLWTYQMAHELKTPLSLLVLAMERMQKRNALGDAEIEDVRAEIDKVSDTISTFLGWAELENTSQQRHLFAVQIAEVFHQVIQRIPEAQSRVLLRADHDLVVAASPKHVEQLVLNLIQNSLKHSANSEIHVKVTEGFFQIQDSGPGLPESVLARLGEPFNRGDSGKNQTRGHGLGLAWITSICRHYGWQIQFENKQPGLAVTVSFS